MLSPEAVADRGVADATGFQAVTGASDQQVSDLSAFRELIAAGAERMNLMGPAQLDVFWERHALDCWQLLELKPEALRWADLGAGAGFPGVVLAIGLKARGGHVTLVESLGKRCGFLREVVAALGLPAEVVQARAEDTPLRVEVVTARACAPMARLLGYAWPSLRQGGCGLFLKGRSVADELAEARRSWRFTDVRHPSRSGAEGRVVEIRGLTRVGR